MYKLEVTKSVEKDFKKHAKEKHEYLLNAIESLSSNPFPVSQYKKLKGTLLNITCHIILIKLHGLHVSRDFIYIHPC
ncbi:type II toxin-antitoxin system RelE family toxin [Candidatus Marithrix sp. Canyon 246]|uniref:type II toxin-antitoxin system RelE family toxin n=1 Tax=Candidatus Marithrix sp. Canyon 246 TaxID=1827136 RepID=UPI000849FD17|nr:hypothetical protein [Candidatus Marithrix sp. Canyon 246]